MRVATFIYKRNRTKHLNTKTQNINHIKNRDKEMILRKSYKDMTDSEIISLIVAGNEEAFLYLIYDRYESDIKFYTQRYYNTLYYLEDLISYLCIHLKGEAGDWQKLKSFKGKSSFRTWFCIVVSHLFLEKRKELIGLGTMEDSIGENPLPEPVEEATNQNKVMVMEAIKRLKNEDYRFILIKELQGYNHKEIAEMIAKKRIKENKVSYYNGKVVVPDAHYVDMNKARALKEVKAIVELINKEWYENK